MTFRTVVLSRYAATVVLLGWGVAVIWAVRDPSGFAKGPWSTLVLTGLSMLLALLIFMVQKGLGDRQEAIIRSVQERVFGTLTSWEQIEDRVVRLVRRANESATSRLFVMAYWTWFGADSEVRKNPAMAFRDLAANYSTVRTLLFQRAAAGLETTLVIWGFEKSEEKLKEFVKAVLGWQRAAAPRKETSDAASEVPSDADVETILGRYREDLTHLSREIRSHRGTRFAEPKLHRDIPTLSFAAIDERAGWAQGIIYLGEVGPLRERAPTGAFISEEPEIVRVIVEQVTRHAKA